jgi:hypothetical protein
MAQVLAIVPTAGLDAVLVAVELALETGPPVRAVSVEHVVNVLGRLNAAAAAADGGHAAEGEHAAAGRHGALRQPARAADAPRRPTMRDVMVELKRCACTAWPAPGPIWSSKAATPGWTARAG